MSRVGAARCLAIDHGDDGRARTQREAAHEVVLRRADHPARLGKVTLVEGGGDAIVRRICLTPTHRHRLHAKRWGIRHRGVRIWPRRKARNL